MALGHYQQTDLTRAGTLMEGGFRLGVAATAGIFVGGSLGTILGIGNLTGITENIEKSTTQAGNSNMPQPRVAAHTITVNFELLEFWPPNFATIRGDSLDVDALTTPTYISGAGSADATFSTGGLSIINPKSFIFKNQTLVSGVTAETVLVVYRARIEQGLAFTPKTDQDTDPVMVLPFTLTGELDTTRTKGDQLFMIETELGN